MKQPVFLIFLLFFVALSSLNAVTGNKPKYFYTNELVVSGVETTGRGSIAYRYVGEGEAAFIETNGFVPNVNLAGKPKNVFASPGKYSGVSEVENALQIGRQNPLGATASPTHRITVDTTGAQWIYGGNVEGGTGVELVTRNTLKALKTEVLGK